MYLIICFFVCCPAEDVKGMTRRAALFTRRPKRHLKRFRFAIKNYRASCKKLTLELDEFIEDGLLNDAIDYRLQSSNMEIDLLDYRLQSSNLEMDLQKIFDLVA